ncbi:MAG: response regulator [Candidatus Andersenbacteria bacterium]
MAKKVLIVEDDQFIREMYALILRKRQYEVVESADGAVGLVEARKGGFDIILLDLMMPQMDGLGFLRELQKQPAKIPNGPIIVMSNLAYSDAKEEAIKLGAKDFLVKADLDPKDVLGIVEKALGDSDKLTHSTSSESS